MVSGSQRGSTSEGESLSASVRGACGFMGGLLCILPGYMAGAAAAIAAGVPAISPWPAAVGLAGACCVSQCVAGSCMGCCAPKSDDLCSDMLSGCVGSKMACCVFYETQKRVSGLTYSASASAPDPAQAPCQQPLMSDSVDPSH